MKVIHNGIIYHCFTGFQHGDMRRYGLEPVPCGKGHMVNYHIVPQEKWLLVGSDLSMIVVDKQPTQFGEIVWHGTRAMTVVTITEANKHFIPGMFDLGEQVIISRQPQKGQWAFYYTEQAS